MTASTTTHQPGSKPNPGEAFIPTLDDMEGRFAGVLIASLGEDGDCGTVLLTADPDAALTAINTYYRQILGQHHAETDTVTADELEAQWVIFERPGSPDWLWLMTPASPSDSRAIQVHVHPA